MAFPTRSTPLWTTGAASSRSFTANLPGTIEPGDLLILLMGMDTGDGTGVLDSTPTDSTSDDWVELIASSVNINRAGAAAYKIADGDEDSGTLTLTATGSNSSIEDIIAGVIRIPAAEWHGTTPPEATAWASRTNDTTPAVPTLNPSGWDVEDTLWIAALISNEDMAGITGPSAYSFNATEGQDWDQAATGGSIPKMAVASIETAAASEGGQDWGAATGWSSAVDHLSAMIAVRPAAGDETAPSLSSPTGTATGETTADLSVSTDEGDGTLYWVVTESATAPSVAQIQAGQDDSGTAAADSGNQAVSATGTQNASATGLTADTTYTAHFQQEDAATNDSAVVSSATFTTDAAGAIRTGHFTSRHVG